MLTIQPLGKASDAAHYYASKDNYYLKDKDSLKESSYWIGQGASKLNLSGVVEQDKFLSLLNGELPNGEVLGIVKNGQREHRSGTDVTLSAPKSVSIIALVGKDTRVVEAHKKAVAATFARIEAMAAEARITFNKQTTFEKTNNLTGATFLHTSSRALDPDLHTHMIILNMTERLDRVWRALSSRSKNDTENLHHGFTDILYQNQHYLGLVYMSTLAKEIKELGFDIRIKDMYGNFEIEGVSDEVIAHLSKRRNEIMADMKERGTTSAKAAEVSNKAKRQVKSDLDSQELFNKWLDDINEMDIDLEKLIQESQINAQKGKIGTTKAKYHSIISPTAIDAIDDGLAHLTEFNTQIKHATLVRQAFIFSAGLIYHEDIEKQIEIKLKDKSLKGKPLEYYITDAMVKKEQAFIQKMTENNVSSLNLKTQSTGLAATLLKNNHKIQIIDVNGKRNQKVLIQEIIDITDSNDMNAYVLHQSKNMSLTLSDEVSRKSTGLFSWLKNLFKDDIVHTVAGFKYHYGSNDRFLNNKGIIVVHDAQKLSVNDLTQLKEMSDKSKGKLILLNNTKSTLGFNPGNPIKTLKRNGIETTTFIGARNDIPVQLKITRQPLNALTEACIKATLGKIENTTVLAITNQQAKELTNNIRALLKEEGLLSRQSKTVKVLSTEGLSDAQKKHTKFYRVGDRITFKAFTKEQTHYEVSDIQKDGLILTNQYGKQSLYKLDKVSEFIVSRAKEIELSIGDKITNDRALFIKRNKFDKHSSFKVTNINEDGIEIQSGKTTIILDNEALKNNYISYNYCKKVSQLTSNDHHILLAALPHRLNTNLMGEITDTAKTVTLFTNNKAKAENFLDKEQLKWTAVEIAEKKPDLIYRDISKAPSTIEKDLNRLIDALELKAGLDKHEVARLAVSYALSKCAEKQAAFKHSDLMTHALKFALGKADFDDIAPILKERMKDGELIHLGTYWTTQEAITLEENIIRTNFKEQGSVKPIEENANKLLSLSNHLTQGQKDAITLATTSNDRFVSVQGLAGVGKTTMMREIQTIANRNGYKVIGLAPTHQSKDELNDAGIDSNTIESFITHHTPIDNKTILIVDESSMIDNQTYHILQNRAIAAGSHVIFAGDMTQLQSLSSGIPHELTIKSGSQKTALMLEIIRQNPNPTLKKAAEFASNRQIGKAFNELEKINPEDYVERTKAAPIKKTSFVEIKCVEIEGKKDLSPLYSAVAEDYLSRTKECQKNTIVIVHAHKDRFVIDQKIRRGLQEQGQISMMETKTERLMQKPIDKPDIINVTNLKSGDVLRFGKTYHVGKRGEYFTVESIDSERNCVSCRTEDNLLINIKAGTLIKGNVSVYTKTKALLAEGDKIRLKLTDENRGFVANNEYEVLSIKDGMATIKNDKETTTLNLKNKGDQHWDYAYTNTAYSTQGATRKFIIALEILARVLVTNHRSTEIDITRASHQGTIYTDNKSGLIERLEDPLRQLNIDKTSALLQQQKFIDEKSKLRSIRENIHNNTKIISHAPSNKQNEIKQAVVNKSANLRTQQIDANELLKALNAQSEHLVKHLLGEPNQHMSKKNEFRYGAKGSFCVNLITGLWHSFETGEGGNLFSLIQQEKGLTNFKDVLDFAVDFTRYQPNYLPAIKPISQAKEIDDRKADEGLRDVAIKLYNKSKAIQGSVVEKYLHIHRGVYQTKHADIRYSPAVYSKVNGKDVKTPALLAFTRNEKGEINHVQITKLDEKTANKNKIFKFCKQTFGRINGHAVNLNRAGEGDITYLTEGIETGLSILEVHPTARVLAVLGKENFAKINLNQLTKHVVLCVDNDGKATFKYQNDGSNKIIKSIERLQENGIKTELIIPKESGQDLNDILVKSGKKALSEALKDYLTPEDYKKICDKENNIVAIVKELKEVTSPVKLTQENNLLHRFNDNKLMQSSIIDKLKNEAMGHNIKNITIDIDALKNHNKTPISQKVMEKEI